MTRAALVRVCCLLALMALSFDKYSWGQLNPSFGVLGDLPPGGRTWQSGIALSLATLLAYVAVVAERRPHAAARVALIELCGFLAFNAVLLVRDGVARLGEWGFSETSMGLFLVAGGLAVRAILLRSVRAANRPPASTGMPASR